MNSLYIYKEHWQQVGFLTYRERFGLPFRGWERSGIAYKMQTWIRGMVFDKYELQFTYQGDIGVHI
jgi:hypothetical protein